MCSCRSEASGLPGDCIEIAARDGDMVGVKSGVKPGERVVVRGAYDVQLASAAKGLAGGRTRALMKNDSFNGRSTITGW